ncbi:MAG: thiol:disulfide interchange protein DsbA/DsbL [Burkholderiaceae bacterium]
MNRRDFSRNLIGSGAGALALSLATPVWAQSGGPTEGKQYSRVEPPAHTQSSGKIEVLEFFSFACPHCHAFEPVVEPWVKKLPVDVVFRRVPVPFLMGADTFMHSYYAFEALGIVDRMMPKVFAALHVERQRLDSIKDMAALVAKNGGDSAKFLEAAKSFSVATNVGRAKKLVGEYKIDGVPAIGVQGRYLTSPSQAGGLEQALTVADFLIQKARKG